VPPFCDHGLDYAEGDIIWIHDIQKDSLFIGNKLALSDNGDVYCAPQGGTVTWKPARIIALNRKDGSVKWESETMDNIGIGHKIVVSDDGTVYAIGLKTLYGFDPDNSSTCFKWEAPNTLPYKETMFMSVEELVRFP
jgi:outer membrane protein assembly factor BamB